MNIDDIPTEVLQDAIFVYTGISHESFTDDELKGMQRAARVLGRWLERTINTNVRMDERLNCAKAVEKLVSAALYPQAGAIAAGAIALMDKP